MGLIVLPLAHLLTAENIITVKDATPTEEVATTTTETIVKVAEAKESKPLPKTDNITSDVSKALLNKFGSDHPLIRVAKCESGHRQYNGDGSLLRGKVNPQDVGVFQINEGYHLKAAQRMGLDIHTLEGNMEYAEHLYDTQGLKPWDWSKGCWNK